ncbi:MAG: hypothetical protein IJX26_02735, partial [Clostridia bacterium]|nr:hypothetical protein [Clostridia bacterium]
MKNKINNINNNLNNKRKELIKIIDNFFLENYGSIIGFENRYDYFLFLETHEESKIFLDKFIDSIKYFFSSEEEFKALFTGLKSYLEAPQNFLEQFLKYVDWFVESNYIYFTEEGIKTQIPTLDLSKSSSQIIKEINNTKYKLCDCFITEDGAVYLAGIEHSYLAFWLSFNGISLNRVLRVGQSQDSNKQISLSSLYPYRGYRRKPQDQLLKLNEEQIKSFYTLFNKLAEGKHLLNSQSFADIICKSSENLGANKNDTESIENYYKYLQYNFMLIEYVVGKDVFNFENNFINV